MSNWKIISQIATGFGIVFIVFAIFAAWINYEIYSIEYGSAAPAAFIQASTVNSMLVFILFAVLSFIVAWITMRSSKEKVSEEMPSAMPEPKHETQTEEIKP
jgi:large-conductance mechanosensitive channel